MTSSSSADRRDGRTLRRQLAESFLGRGFQLSASLLALWWLFLAVSYLDEGVFAVMVRVCVAVGFGTAVLVSWLAAHHVRALHAEQERLHQRLRDLPSALSGTHPQENR